MKKLEEIAFEAIDKMTDLRKDEFLYNLSDLRYRLPLSPFKAHFVAQVIENFGHNGEIDVLFEIKNNAEKAISNAEMEKLKRDLRDEMKYHSNDDDD